MPFHRTSEYLPPSQVTHWDLRAWFVRKRSVSSFAQQPGSASSPRSAPSNLIGANDFAGRVHYSRVCGAQHRRAEGVPLTVILNGKRIVGTVGRPPAPIGLARWRRPRNGEQQHTPGKRTDRPASAAVPRQRPRAKGARLSRRHGREPAPSFPPEDQGGQARPVSRIPLRHFAPTVPDPFAGGGPNGLALGDSARGRAGGTRFSGRRW